MYLLFKIKSRNRFINLLIKYLVIIITLVLFVASIKVINEKKNYGEESYNLRVSDFQAGIKLFKEKPLVGWGIENYEPHYMISNSPRGNSNGFITLFFQVGLLGVSIYYILLNTSYRNIKKYYGRSAAVVYVSFIVIYNSFEPFTYNNFTILLILMNVYKLKVEKKNEDITCNYRT